MDTYVFVGAFVKSDEVYNASGTFEVKKRVGKLHLMIHHRAAELVDETTTVPVEEPVTRANLLKYVEIAVAHNMECAAADLNFVHFEKK